MSFTNPETQEAFDNILNVCGGGDNGKFVSWMAGMKQLDKEGSEKSKLVVGIMIRFSKLIDTLDNIAKENRS